MKKYLEIFLILFLVNIKNKHKMLGAVLVFLMLIFFSFQKVDAFEVKNNILTNYNFSNIYFFVNAGVGKTIDLKNTSGNIMLQNFNLDIGKSVTLFEKNTDGDWFAASDTWDSPPMDGVLYKSEMQITDIDACNGCAFRPYFFGFSLPIDKGVTSIVSDNSQIVSCSNLACTAKGPGTARLIVNFNTTNFSAEEKKGVLSTYSDGDINLNGPLTYDNISTFGITGTTGGTVVSPYANIPFNNYGYTMAKYVAYEYYSAGWRYTRIQKPFAYNFPSITYTITVPPAPNTSQDSTCTGTSNITKNSATVNWTYTDVDNDPQTQYQVQLSTDPAFALENIVFASSSASANTSHTFTGLTPNTTYYSRVQTYNAVNGPSGYSSCSFGFTTLEDETPPEPVTIGSCNGTRTFTWTTDGVVTSTEPNSDQCAFKSSCTSSTDSTQTYFTYSPEGTNIGNVTYTHPGVSEVKSGPSYIYTYSATTTPGTRQSLTVTLTDSDGETSNAICSVDNGSLAETTKINITKAPRITLNKGGTCSLTWNITPTKPDDMICTLTGNGVNETLEDSSSGQWISGPLYKNTKYTISCTGSETVPDISESVICRINPSIGEI